MFLPLAAAHAINLCAASCSELVPSLAHVILCFVAFIGAICPASVQLHERVSLGVTFAVAHSYRANPYSNLVTPSADACAGHLNALKEVFRSWFGNVLISGSPRRVAQWGSLLAEGTVQLLQSDFLRRILKLFSQLIKANNSLLFRHCL